MAPLTNEADRTPFHQLPYQAREWGRSRKLVARVEATTIGTDVRFIVTNLEGRGKTLYEKVFCARGHAENLIKDMKRFTRSDKTACSRWQANQFRLFLHVGAYWLLHGLRQAAPKRSRWRGATFETIRRTFVKIAVRVEELKGKIKLAFPASYPLAAMLAVMTGAITTRAPDRRGMRRPSPEPSSPACARAFRRRPAVNPADAARPPPVGFTTSDYGE